MAEIIKTLGGTLTYTAGNHRYTWNGERVDLSVSGVARSFPLNFGAASGWAAPDLRRGGARWGTHGGQDGRPGSRRRRKRGK